MNDSLSKQLRKRNSINYTEKALKQNINQIQSVPSSSSKKRTRIEYNCFCGKINKSKLTYCYGPECPWGWVHLKCLGLKAEPFQREFCSEKCKNDEIALMAIENDADLKDYDWCSCRKQRGGEMVECEKKKSCSNGWYHLSCVGLTSVPSNKWICQDCIEKKSEMKSDKIKNIKKFVVAENSFIDSSHIIDHKSTVVVKHQLHAEAKDLSEGYCICKKEPDDTMIECMSPKCPNVWFHLSCVNLKDFPNPDIYWCCSDSCKTELSSYLQNDF
uniref:PHD-type domain-containing protein n=1 Tax=Panagrolaimus sp. ES5 TaxID=591445 RepID=A0AC34G6F6_9BILA